MKKIVCIHHLVHPDLDLTQGIFELVDGYPEQQVVGGGIDGLQQFAGARIERIRRLGTGMIELTLELPEQAAKEEYRREQAQKKIATLTAELHEDRRRVVRCLGEGDDLFLVDATEKSRCFLLKISPVTGLLYDVTGWKNVTDLTDVPPEERARVLALVESDSSPKVERRWSLEEIKAAWLQAQETSRLSWEHPREANDLENSWDHVRGALTGEKV